MILSIARQRRMTRITTLSRRSFLAGAGSLAVARVQGRVAQTDEDRTVLEILCWPGYDEPDILAPFTERTGVEVKATRIGANDEFFLFLRAGGLGRYDLITPHNGVVVPLAEAGLIQPLDPNLIPNAADLFPRFRWPDWVRSDDQVWGVPFLWGTSPMVYLADQFEQPPESWRVVEEKRFQGKVAMTEDGLGHLMLWNYVLGHADPTRVTVAELNETTDYLIELKSEQAIAFVASVTELVPVLASGRAWISTIGWEAAPWLPGADGRLRTTHPAPGDYSFCDNLCIPTQAPHPDLAHALIDHLLSPEIQATLMDRLKRGTVNQLAVDLLSDDARGLYDYGDLDAVFAVSPLRGFPPLTNEGNGIATYVDWVKAWERVRFTPMASGLTSGT